MTSVSIIICTHNRADSLKLTLESLARLEVPAGHWVELIVVDNASTDETAKTVQTAHLPNLPLCYFHESRRGKSVSLNAALKIAKGEIILWTDDDVRVPLDWIARMCELIERGEADVVGGEVVLAPHLERDWLMPFHRLWLADTRELPKERLPFGVNMAFHRRVLQAVPSLDSELGPGTLGSGEEILFCLQLVQAGFRIVPVSCAVEHHFEPSRLLYSGWKKRAWIEGRMQAYYCYHWFHGGVRLAGLRAFIKMLQLAWFRLLRGPVAPTQEGCSFKEADLIKCLEFFRGYAKEEKKPRAYALKGLVKRNLSRDEQNKAIQKTTSAGSFQAHSG
jgi:glycosyltransferase involved in cell wall biosynthesis